MKKTKEELVAAKERLYSNGTGKLFLDIMTDLVMEDGWSKAELQCLVLLREGLIFHNEGVVEAPSDSWWYRGIKKLEEKGVVKIGKKGYYLLHPWYGWIGHPSFQDQRLDVWVREMLRKRYSVLDENDWKTI